MRKKFAKHIYSLTLLVLVLLFSVSLFSGCQSTDKSESYLDTSKFEKTQFDYDADKNQTKIIWTTTLTNNTIYNFRSFSITFKLYKNNTLVETKTRDYSNSKGVKHGTSYAGDFVWYVDNEIDSIEYVSWSAKYDSF